MTKALAILSFSVLLGSGCTADNPLYCPMCDGFIVDLPPTPDMTPPIVATGEDATLPDLAQPPSTADMTRAEDMAATPDMALDCRSARATCRAHLAAGCTSDGVYAVHAPGLAPMTVYCDMHADGGGWALVYSNSNNWADPGAATVPSVQAQGEVVYRWYDSRWQLNRALSNRWLGREWNGQDPLRPDSVGAVNVDDVYRSGSSQVRMEFVRGSDAARASGWCDTGGTWDWSAANTTTFACKRPAPAGSGVSLCISGGKKPCDGSGGNSGWIHSVMLGRVPADIFDTFADWAYQSCPNSVGPAMDHGGPQTGQMVIGWNQPAHVNNAMDQDYQIRIWLRAP